MNVFDCDHCGRGVSLQQAVRAGGRYCWRCTKDGTAETLIAQREQRRRKELVDKHGEETIAKWETEALEKRAAEAEEIRQRQALLSALPWHRRLRKQDHPLGLVASAAGVYTVLLLLFAIMNRSPLWPPTYVLGGFILAAGMGVLPAIVWAASGDRSESRRQLLVGAIHFGLFIGMFLMGLLLVLAIPLTLGGHIAPDLLGACHKGAPWNC